MPPAMNERGIEVYKLRVGGRDARKEVFKGWVEVEPFARNAVAGSFCLMRKDMVSALYYSSVGKTY
jgi:serine/threonine-protein kinase Chk1